ncbi:hypothetical protein EA473_07755 [Natrarchaeobius chitinivorans]|uniref:Uncharacterized protein n=1 Tax=Natrarchaeobius chitinivorans TaxID=1679083 RepID=A0A3N6LX81_NATCH|nr:hypothetical protein EA473_07755 [Natrarchaeobius chitinivorans]
MGKATLYRRRTDEALESDDVFGELADEHGSRAPREVPDDTRPVGNQSRALASRRRIGHDRRGGYPRISFAM